VKEKYTNSKDSCDRGSLANSINTLRISTKSDHNYKFCGFERRRAKQAEQAQLLNFLLEQLGSNPEPNGSVHVHSIKGKEKETSRY
jgi:hypothetical protein